MFAINHRQQRASVLAAGSFVFILVVACQSEPTAPVGSSVESARQTGQETVLAVYEGGSVTRGEYEGMLLRTVRRDQPERRLEILEMVAVTEVMADLALSAGAEQRVNYQVSLRLLTGKTLSEALRRHVGMQTTVSDDETTAAVEERKELYSYPKRWRLRYIFKKLRKEGEPLKIDQIRSRMEAVHQELAAGADFSVLAMRESDSQTRIRGGRLGLIDPDRFDPILAEAAKKLKPGETSPIIETPMGLVILHCDEIVEAATEDDEEIRRRVEQSLRNARAQAAWEEIGLQLLEGVWIDHTALLEPEKSSLPVITFPDGDTIGREMVVEFFRQAGELRPPEEMFETDMNTLLRNIALIQQAASRALELGLNEDPQVEAALVWGRLVTLAGEEIRDRVQSRFEPTTEVEARHYFAKHPDGFQHPNQYQISAIVIDSTKNGIHESYESADALLAEIRQGRVSFETAAGEYSHHSSAVDGGALGWLSRWELKRLGLIISEVVPTLEPGHISDVLQVGSPNGTSDSIWIVKLTATQPSRPMSFEEAVGQGMITELDERRWNALLDEVWQEVLAEIDVRPVDLPAD